VHGLITHVSLSCGIARLQLHDSKAPEWLQVLRSKPAAGISQLTWTIVMGENATP